MKMKTPALLTGAFLLVSLNATPLKTAADVAVVNDSVSRNAGTLYISNIDIQIPELPVYNSGDKGVVVGHVYKGELRVSYYGKDQYFDFNNVKIKSSSPNANLTITGQTINQTSATSGEIIYNIELVFSGETNQIYISNISATGSTGSNQTITFKIGYAETSTGDIAPKPGKPSDPNGGDEGGDKPSDPNGGDKPSDPNGGDEGGDKPSDPNGGDEGGDKPSDPNDGDEGGNKPSDPNGGYEGGDKPSDLNGGDEGGNKSSDPNENDQDGVTPTDPNHDSDQGNHEDPTDVTPIDPVQKPANGLTKTTKTKNTTKQPAITQARVATNVVNKPSTLPQTSEQKQMNLSYLGMALLALLGSVWYFGKTKRQ